jgi:hypothetical protein
MLEMQRPSVILLLIALAGCDRATPPRAAVESNTLHATLAGRTVGIVPLGATFQIPQSWLDWHAKYKNSIHLSRRALDAVRIGEAEWDAQYSQIANETIPFGSCVLHAGEEGWGSASGSFADVQMRVYIVDNTPAQVVERVVTVGYAAAAKISKDATRTSSTFHDWKRGRLSYELWYDDYGGTAGIDVFARTCGKKTVVLVFMCLADAKPNQKEVEDIVLSFKCAK